MTDYSKAVIYGIYCKDKNVLEIYIGSTHDEIERERHHKGYCNNENNDKYNYKVYQFIRANGGYGNWNFEVLEQFPCENEEQLRIREQYYYDLLNPALNTNRPYVSEDKIKEYHKITKAKHYQNNREEILKRHTKYKKDNREKINKKFICDCGIEYTLDHRARHCDSKRHKNFILNRVS